MTTDTTTAEFKKKLCMIAGIKIIIPTKDESVDDEYFLIIFEEFLVY